MDSPKDLFIFFAPSSDGTQYIPVGVGDPEEGNGLYFRDHIG